jgi:hypothetical protein
MSPSRIAIADALAKHASAVQPAGHERWTLVLANGTDFAATARADDGWLVLEAPFDQEPPSPARAWQWLRWNASLEGGARFALRPDATAACACADLPIEDDVDLARRVGEACRGLTAAKELVSGVEPVDSALAGHGGGALADLCRETGWEFVDRDGGRLAVDLDVPGSFHQATVAVHGGGVAVTVPVLDAAASAARAPVCEEAVGLLLARVCGVVRLARVVGTMRDGVPGARFEVVFASRPCAAELTHAFAALSVAARIAAREATVLWSNESVADAYVRQWDRRNQGGGS